MLVGQKAVAGHCCYIAHAIYQAHSFLFSFGISEAERAYVISSLNRCGVQPKLGRLVSI